ncbi:hypothetical protein [Azospirillum sp. Sh1]|uniref:hypothetical protein n=1 Tax=Azospirillum sp. Sh1 TaxID=2607285 RepID=UPI0011ECA37B|nr:hypothetical protein [Azospirillum sp. Sh1]KAA0577594.1 hypothetical protein FZ029_10585 [Azospirillum sp. Sh1]
MNRVSILEEKGSFRLMACDGRFAVVEARAGQVFGLPDDARVAATAPPTVPTASPPSPAGPARTRPAP